ncbi:MAG: hypothetical protein ACW99G_00355 [Candidatus Thorarchaeota archaeon]|jgi:hypothetical protein
MQLLVEHSVSPGTIYEDVLIYGSSGCILNEMSLHEASDGAGGNVLKFRGKFQEANAINKNKRMYPFEVLDSSMKSLSECVENGGLCGELDHPTDSIIHFINASHKVTKLWWEGKTLMGEGHILNTPCGKVLKALINDGVRIGISSRGVGNGKVNENGILVIGESYKLITFDCVADPSTHEAFQTKIASKKESIVVPEYTSEIQVPNVKNEATGIHTPGTVSKELVLACLSGIVRKQASDIKARLN